MGEACCSHLLPQGGTEREKVTVKLLLFKGGQMQKRGNEKAKSGGGG